MSIAMDFSVLPPEINPRIGPVDQLLDEWLGSTPIEQLPTDGRPTTAVSR
jgi:hypothetical protein